MITESSKYKELKEIIKLEYKNLGSKNIFEEVYIKNYIVDIVIIKDGRIIKVIKCIARQNITNAMKKLMEINLDCKKEIVRFYR